MRLLTGYEVDERLRWVKGRAERMARAGKLPHLLLPDGSIRFNEVDVQQFVQRVEPSNGGPR